MQTEPSPASHAGADRATVAVLGGYGNFGAHICEALARDRDIASSSPAAIVTRRVRLPSGSAPMSKRWRSIIATVRFRARPNDAAPASSCTRAGRSRDSTTTSRRRASSARGVLIASGASSLPALSSAVVDREAPRFARLDDIRYGIASSAKTSGLATVQAVMSYVGKPFERWEGARWVTVHGWQDATRERYPDPVGRRFLASCDVPDLALSPHRYPDVRAVVFRAGLGFAATTLAAWAFSWLVRGRVVDDRRPYAPAVRALATRLERWATQTSAMQVRLSGIGHDGAPLVRTWSVVANANHGTRIPCLPAIALARELVRGETTARGAMPCMGLLGVDEILGALHGARCFAHPIPPSRCAAMTGPASGC